MRPPPAQGGLRREDTRPECGLGREGLRFTLRSAASLAAVPFVSCVALP